MSAISIEYIYSACVVISTPNQRILCDPWFTEAIYDGSWFHYPRINDPISRIGDVDCIYVSHIHPDHYDPRFLLEYFNAYGRKEVFIAEHNPNYLFNKMNMDGLSPTIIARDDKVSIGNTSLQIIPVLTGSKSDIDSALIVKLASGDRTHCVVNANDIVYSKEIVRDIKFVSGDVDMLLCGYTGAGPYPQTYYDIKDSDLVVEANKKKQSFFERYLSMVRGIDARVNLPFAGKYILGGRLSKLNYYRGVADAVEVLAIDEKAVILADMDGIIDTESFAPSAVRVEAYDPSDLDQRIKEVSGHKMLYEKLINDDQVYQLQIRRLLLSAYYRAIKKSELDIDYYFVFPVDQYFIVMNANGGCSNSVLEFAIDVDLPSPRSEIYIDPRYLFGLLVGMYHWNNAEVGSHYCVRRIPNIFNRKAQRFLNFLSVI